MNKKSVFSEKEFVEWGGFLNEFLWICAGVNRTVLRQCPTDYAKYAGIGGTILFTALMACLSGSYALYSVFYNAYVAIGFGIFWGSLIFNLDRFIVNTMYSDGKSTISWKELMSGAPRIIMAIFLGIVISTPLELKIFEDAIDIRIEQDKDNILNERISGSVLERDSIAKKRDAILNNEVTMFDSQITTSSTETNNILGEINTLRVDLNKANAEVDNYSKIISNLNSQRSKYDKNSDSYKQLTNKIVQNSTLLKQAKNKKNLLAKQINTKQGEAAASDTTLKSLMANKQSETQNEAKRLQNAVDSINKKIEFANVRHETWTEKQIKEKGSFKDKLDIEYKGFQAKMHAFSELKEESESTKLSALFIMLLFVIIETAPTFFKMMMEDGPYDFLLDAEKEMIRLNASDSLRDYKDGLQANLQISIQRNQERIDAEKKANSEIMKKNSSIQMDLLDEALQRWKKEELAKIEEEPSKFISTNNEDIWK